MTGREFISIAVQLRATRSEAAYRTRISRAYYAAFLEARQFAIARAGMKRDRSSATHRLVAEALIPFDPQFQIDLGILRGMRNGADYDLELSSETLALQADQATTLAASVISRLDGYLSRDKNTDGVDVATIGDLAAYMPADAGAQDDVALILLSFPQLPTMVLRAISVVSDVLPGSSVSLDTRTYDDWEPPLGLVIKYAVSAGNEVALLHRLMARLRKEDGFDDDLIQIVPMPGRESSNE